MKNLQIKKKGISLILTSCMAFFYSPLFATELHYLVSINDKPKGVLILNIDANEQVKVSHRGLSSGDNLLFYADSKSFALINAKNNTSSKTLTSITVNDKKHFLHYDTNDELGKELLKQARVAKSDSNNRAFIIDEKSRPIYNFPTMNVLNTEGLLLGIAKINANQGQQIYYYEPASNRFYRTYLEKGVKENLGKSQCKVTSRTLRLDQDGQPNVPLIKLDMGNNYALQASAASGAWSLKLVAAGQAQQHKLPINDQILALSASYMNKILAEASINESSLKIVHNNYLITQNLSYQVSENLLKQKATEELGLTNTNIKIKETSQDYSLELPIKNSCNSELKKLTTNIEEDIILQAKYERLIFEEAKIKLTSKDSSCTKIEAEIELSNKNDLFNHLDATNYIKGYLKSYSKSLIINNDLDTKKTPYDKNELTKKINLKLTSTLDEEHLKNALLSDLGVKPNQKLKLVQKLVKSDDKFVASIEKQQVIANICSEKSIQLSTSHDIQLESTQASSNQCYFQLIHSLPKQSISSAVINQFMESHPHFKILNNKPSIEGENLVFSSIYGIEGENNACQ